MWQKKLIWSNAMEHMIIQSLNLARYEKKKERKRLPSVRNFQICINRVWNSRTFGIRITHGFNRSVSRFNWLNNLQARWKDSHHKRTLSHGLHSGEDDVFAPAVWHNFSPQKCKFFLWLLCRQRLSSNAQTLQYDTWWTMPFLCIWGRLLPSLY